MLIKTFNKTFNKINKDIVISYLISFSLDNLLVINLSLINLISNLLTIINNTNIKISNSLHVLLHLYVLLRYYHVYSSTRR